MTAAGSALTCAGCGWSPAPEEPYPFRCPRAGSDDVDHVVARSLDAGEVVWPTGQEANPFVRYRSLAHAYRTAMARGMADADYVDLVERLDKEVAAVDGRGFIETPFFTSEALGSMVGLHPPGELWVKDETMNVSGSHKGRHLMGVMIYLRVAEETGLADRRRRPDLAIASCGNAALAAAVLARAGGYRLRVFVPTWADPAVIERLRGLRAVTEVCERDPGVPGDPTYQRLRDAIRDGALPFTCQGNENGLAVEGGETLAYEMVDALHRSGSSLDRIFIQVGGGALASGVAQGLSVAARLGALDRMPVIHAVQTRGGHPLERAFVLVSARAASSAPDEALEYAARHRSEFMWPWEEEPRSIAHGILDDETYDWMAVLRGMMATGGTPIVADEAALGRANQIGKETTGIDVDHTGTAGLAGLVALEDRGAVGPEERVAVLFTGARR